MSGVTTFYGVTYPSSTDYVKDGATAIETVATGFDSAVAIPTYNAQTGTTYTFVLLDTGKVVTASNVNAQTYTIPPTASVAWTANTTLRVLNLGSGVVTFAAGAGVTVTNTAQTLSQYQSAQLVRTGLNAWTVTPDSGQASGMSLVSSTTFSAVTSHSVDSCFTSAYANYKLIWSITNSTGTNPDILLRLRASAADANTNYNSQLLISYNTTTESQTNTSGTDDWTIGSASSTFTFASGVFDLFNPQLTAVTYGIGLTNGAYGTQQNRATVTGNTNTNVTSYDGIKFFIGSGNITGTLRIYGYSN